jgi:hypothetical protein
LFFPIRWLWKHSEKYIEWTSGVHLWHCYIITIALEYSVSFLSMLSEGNLYFQGHKFGIPLYLLVSTKKCQLYVVLYNLTCIGQYIKSMSSKDAESFYA